MSGQPRASARYVMAPIVDGAAAWDRGVDLVLAPIRLSPSVSVVRPRLAGQSPFRSRPESGGAR